MKQSGMIVKGLFVIALSAAVGGAGGLGGCKNSVQEENALLSDEVSSLRTQLSDRNTALEQLNAELRSRDQQLAESRRGGSGAGGGATGFEGIEGVTAHVGAGEITATVQSDLLFDSGKATLKPAAKKSLDQLASVLNSTYGGKTVRIAGHTDTDPIQKSGYKSNYHLGFERAYAVRDYLVSRGVATKRIYLASFGPDLPKNSKPQSRRVEIAVVTGD